MKTYIFAASVEQDDDGRWSAWIEALPGCATWGHTQAEALDALKDATEAYIEVLLERGGKIPRGKGVKTLDAPAVTVMV